MAEDWLGERRIDEEIDRLESMYGDFKIIEEESVDEPELFETTVERVKSGWMGDAGGVVIDNQGRTLLIRHESNPEMWGSPGGGHDIGETHEETAKRESREETGVEVKLKDVLYARKKYIEKETDSDLGYCMLTVDFLAKYVKGEVSVDDDEIIEARWFDTIPENSYQILKDMVQEIDEL